MESVSCCYQDNNPAMANECGTQLSDAGDFSINKLQHQKPEAGGGAEEMMTETEAMKEWQSVFMCAA